MKASKLIKELLKNIIKYGDLEVWRFDNEDAGKITSVNYIPKDEGWKEPEHFEIY